MTKRNLLHLVFDCPMKMTEARQGSESDELESPETRDTFRGSGRDKERRNTDFSQADNDLKRFLSEREQKRRDSAEQLDLLISPTYKSVSETIALSSEKSDPMNFSFSLVAMFL